ncbi:3-hydroxyisobutyrate dehydrogenase [Micromonospora pallida]|uniref:3-hydroxyisobutyrate dehydrogenase n=1 Tax=Micromonospora pallida TaxID=145854 RepID=A0A1C6RU82_9ACTN|nr:NAD(P)-dependent oxidoreductase [Micromonospora pallida]SCL20767.1 3-hydroxyisobutyrate dehydrogenase [Micromonospora pallida]
MHVSETGSGAPDTPVVEHGGSSQRPLDPRPVAVCGLGLMGRAVAARLLDCGVPVVVWNRHPERARDLAERGARVADSPADLAAGAGAVIVLVDGGAAVTEVIAGAEGIAAGHPDVLVQMSTIGVDEARAIRSLLPPTVALLDAPVLGSWAQAAAGELRILTGGDVATVDRWRPLLTLLGDPVHVGDVPAGTAFKQVVLAAVAPMVALLGEALALSDRLDLDRGAVLDELERSRIGPLVKRKRRMLESGHYPPDARVDTFAKDMGLVERAGRAHGLAMTMATAARQRADEAIAAGLGHLDYSVLYRAVARHDADGVPGCG